MRRVSQFTVNRNASTLFSIYIIIVACIILIVIDILLNDCMHFSPYYLNWVVPNPTLARATSKHWLKQSWSTSPLSIGITGYPIYLRVFVDLVWSYYGTFWDICYGYNYHQPQSEVRLNNEVLFFITVFAGTYNHGLSMVVLDLFILGNTSWWGPLWQTKTATVWKITLFW